jgi:integrase
MLARFGGLRCPSDVLALRWEWVDLPGHRMQVFAPKTNSFRAVPIFPELLPYLADAFDRAEFVVNRGSDIGDRALYSGFKKRLKRAGVTRVTPWPKLFQNLRSTRETELVEKFPVHVVAGWLGNTPSVATQHYLQVTDDHFRRAIGEPQKPAVEDPAESEPKKRRNS